jgi:hypothetical protein
MYPGFWWQNELETWLGRLVGKILKILCLFAMLKKTVMAESIFTLSVEQLDFSVLGYCVSSFIGG